MSIKYEPSKLIKKTKLRKKAANLINENKTINRAAVKSLTDFGVLPKKTLERVALKVIKQMKASESANGDSKLIQSRVQSAALYEQTRAIKRAYRGEFYEWLKSTAKNPREEHIENYGKTFQLGVGDKDGNDPGDLPGCQCGMRIITDDTREEFNERLEDAI